MAQLVFFIFALVFSVLVNGLFLKFSKTLGLKNNNDQGTVIRWGSTSKPAFGGISFYIVFLASFAVYGAFGEGMVDQPYLMGVLTATSLGFLIGLADDAYNTKPILKFSGQLACGLILIYSGNYIHLFDSNALNYSLTLLWVVGMMNSINMLDNMDGITTVVSIGSGLGVVVLLILSQQSNHFFVWIMLGMIASLIGFLRYNWNPSKMYMGDTGSQYLGVLLAAAGIHFFWNNYGNQNEGELLQVAAALLAFMPSIMDTTIVVINRVRRGQSPFVGGKDHTTHHLGYMGLQDRQVAWCFLGSSFISVALALWLLKAEPRHQFSILIIAGVYCAVTFSLLFWVTQQNKERR